MDSSTFVNQTLNIPGVQFTIEDNQFNNYDRYTYHFTLSMVGEQDSRDPTIDQRLSVNPAASVPNDAPQHTKPVRKIIIAQSGVTVGLNLISVSIEDSVSSNLRYKNSVTTEILMTITEPYSINLVDQMFLASRELGVRNWRLAPLFLELEFKGYKEDGTLLESKDFNVRRVWKILFVDFESTLTQVGTTYKIKAVSQNTQGFLDIYYQIPATQQIEMSPSSATSTPRVPGSLSLQGGTTVKEFFKKLGEQLTKYYFEQRTNNNQPRTPFLIYTFEIADEIGNQFINADQFANGRRMSFTNVSQNGRMLVISKGISITALLDDVIASTKTDPDKPWFLVDEAKGIVLIPRVECLVRNVGYDSLNNDYIREMTFVVSAKHSTRPVMTREIGQNLQLRQLENQRDRLKWIASRSLKKAYPYYYTGRNTEIINLNIVFQNMHVIPLPLVSSTERSAADASQLAPLRQQIANEENTLQQRREELRRLQEQSARRGGLNPPGYQAAIDARQREITQREETIRQLQRQESALLGQVGGLAIFDANIEGRLQLQGIDVRSIAITPGSQQLRDAFVAAENQNQSRLSQLRRREFVEDITIFDLDPAQYTYIADPRDIANTMARSQAPGPGNPPGAGPATPPDQTRRYYTTILAQIYDRSLNHLTEIEMDIKGDPYWFGKTNLERERELVALFDNERAEQAALSQGLPAPPARPAPERRNIGTVIDSTKANYYDYDAHFLLIFRGGQIPDPDTGFPDLKKSVYFSAVYQAITVTHKFENGAFTQKINAVRDALINLDGLRSVSSAPPQPSGPTGPPPPLPSGPTGPPVAATPPPPATPPRATPRGVLPRPAPIPGFNPPAPSGPR